MQRRVHFKIYGKVIDQETRKPLPGLTVKALDEDLLFDDLLGSAITDESGEFEIRYDSQDFQELFLDKKPDIFLRIENAAGELIHTTRDQVRAEAGKVEKFLIAIPPAVRPRPHRRRRGTESR